MQESEGSRITWFRSTASSSPLPNTGVITSSLAWPSCGLFYLSLKINVQWYSQENESGTTRSRPFSFLWQVKKMRVTASWNRSWLSAWVINTLPDAAVIPLPRNVKSRVSEQKQPTQRWFTRIKFFFICENNHNGIKCNKIMLLVGETAYCFRVNYDNFH